MHLNGTGGFVSGSGLRDRPSVRACPGDAVLCMGRIRRGPERGGEEKTEQGRVGEGRVGWRSSVKPAVDFHPTCGDAEKGREGLNTAAHLN